MSKQDAGSGQGSMLALGILVLVLVCMWPFYRPYFARGVVTLAVYEAQIVLAFRPLLPDGYRKELITLVKRGRPLMRTKGVAAFKKMSDRDIFRAWNIPSRAVAPLFVLLSVLAAWHIKDSDVASRYRRRLRLEDLIKAQAPYYPHLRPIASVRIDKLALREGPWRIKMNYIEFALHYQLLRDGQGKLITTAHSHFKAASFDSKRARAVMLEQLGKRWDDNLASLGPLERAMFGVLAAMAASDRKGMKAATEEMNLTWAMKETKGKAPKITLTCAKAEALAVKHWDHPEVQACRKGHAYFLTVMSALAERKFNAGELCISHYIWLRPTDPLLFYTLHQQGLPRPNLEAIAPFVHYQIERRRGIAITEPAIEKGVEGLKTALLEEGWLHASILDGDTKPRAKEVRDWNGTPEGYADSAT